MTSPRALLAVVLLVASLLVSAQLVYIQLQVHPTPHHLAAVSQIDDVEPSSGELDSIVGDDKRPSDPEEHDDIVEVTPYPIIVSAKKPFPALQAIANGTLAQRLTVFNLAIEQLTANVLEAEGAHLNPSDRASVAAAATNRTWSNELALTSPHTYVVVNRNNYVVDLMTRFPLVKVLILPWLLPKYGKLQWRSSSYHDVYNLDVKTYYTWIAAHPLCHWLQFSWMSSHTYSAAYSKSCTAVKPHSPPPAVHQVKLGPVHFYAKTMSENRYWPNYGRGFPMGFFRHPPSFALILHVLVDAVVKGHGHVIGRGAVNATNSTELVNVKLTRYSCKEDADRTRRVPKATADTVVCGRVLVASMLGGTAYYHRLLEVIPRLAPYVDFLRRNPDVRIHVTDVDKLTVGMLQALGIPNAARRAVKGLIRANIAYVPRFAECLWPRPVDTQLAARAFRLYIERHLLPVVRRDRVVMVRRTKNRRTVRKRVHIESFVKRIAEEYGLRFSLFSDNPAPSLSDTMKMFHEAVLVVAPHGAGLANIIFSLPGTFVVEMVCQTRSARLCYLHTSHLLGHRWYGVPAKSGCPLQINIDTTKVEAAIRFQLREWNATRYQSNTQDMPGKSVPSTLTPTLVKQDEGVDD